MDARHWFHLQAAPGKRSSCGTDGAPTAPPLSLKQFNSHQLLGSETSFSVSAACRPHLLDILNFSRRSGMPMPMPCQAPATKAAFSRLAARYTCGRHGASHVRPEPCKSVMRGLQEEFRGGAQPAASHDGGGSEGRAASWWSSGDPEAKRRRRVAGYKAYAVEARVKASLRKGFRWIKDRCTGLVRRY